MNPSQLRSCAAASSFLRSARRPLRIAPRPSLLALLAAAALAAPGRAEAQAPEAGPGEHALPPGTETAPAVLTGRVLLSGGAPAPGAVVVTSAGGQAVTDARGEFSLEVAVPGGAERLQLTAVASLAGGPHVASVQIGPVTPHRSTDAGTIGLEASSGCLPSWLPTFGEAPGSNGEVVALAVFDEGGGPALYAGGWFTTVGGIEASRIAKWDGSSWAPLGSGMNQRVESLAVFDDGGGPALYAGGHFTTAGGVEVNRIAKWDGSSWTPLGSGMEGGVGTVAALAVFDDGGGPALYAGGTFLSAGGVAANRVAKWNGASWSPLGSGMSGGGSVFDPTSVNALAVHDDGTGAALYAGGKFTTAGGIAASSIAKWDGSSWAPLGSGMNDSVRALAAFDDGSGRALYAGGKFATAGGVTAFHVARWDGSSWSPLASGPGKAVSALAVFDDGEGPALYAGGEFQPSGDGGVAKWNGSGWTPLGSGLNNQVSALAVFDDGGGPALYAGGIFTTVADVAANRIARLDASGWSPLGSGMNDSVRAIAVFDDGAGPALYAGGSFSIAGGVVANRIARWDGSSWSPLGSGMSGTQDAVHALAVFDDGGGAALYAGGSFTTPGAAGAPHVARWDGSSWSPLGSGIGAVVGGPPVSALAVFDDGEGPALYAGGQFTTAGGVAVSNIAKWDGSGWSPLGSGLGGVFDHVRALAVFDDGAGAALYAGGNFFGAAPHVAKWDGATWSPLGSGMSGGVFSLAVFDDGEGAALYAGGYFTVAGGVEANRIAKWDGSSWAPLGSGMGIFNVSSLAVFDDGEGPALYAGGHFSAAGGVAANSIAKWDGSSWAPLGSGVAGGVLTPTVSALAVFDDGGGPALYAGGSFTATPDSGDSYLAKWGCSSFAPVPGCFGNPATLSAISSAAKIGQPLVLQLEAGAFPTGTALLFAGLDGTDAGGCGLLLPGFGELLLALAPVPILAAQDAMSGGIATLTTSVPAVPALVGVTFAYQAANFAALPGAPIELSTGLAVTFVP